MTRAEAGSCPTANDGEHDWIDISTMNDAGERFSCKWCSREAWEPIRKPSLGHSIKVR